MHWSKRLVTFKGVDVYLHASTFWLLMWLVVFVYLESGWINASMVVVLALLIFAMIVACEFAVAARMQSRRIQPRSIVIFPFGGVTRLARCDTSASHADGGGSNRLKTDPSR